MSVMTTLIGDVIASKSHKHRNALQFSLREVLEFANRTLSPVQPLELSIGDEFQGAFTDIGAASRATLIIRLGLLVEPERIDTRYGLGEGDVMVFDAARAPTSQDGPGWWAARAAIENAKALEESPRASFARTCFTTATEDAGGQRFEASVEALLLCRDALVDRMNARQRRLLLGLMLGQSQGALAIAENVTQSAVSQSLHRSYAFAVEAAQRRLEKAFL
jgi:hypothetical protein